LKSYYWDQDGINATANLLLATFDTRVTLTLEHFLLV